MNNAHQKAIVVTNASENNLKNISLELPHNKFIVVTGVSGSGKSSLVFDVIAAEGQRRFLETYASFSRLFMGKLQQPAVESIEGLLPVISIGQTSAGSNIRSTLGTMSEMYDLLRLLFARAGTAVTNIELSRSLFSFNSPLGACPHCKGIGLEETIDVNKLISDPAKTLRQGALAPSQPNGYIMYSQVTIDVLNRVCNAHGFDVDTPWNELSAQQQDVILNGSTRIKVPFGKHSLESRLKWTGITALPREEAYYKGMLPIMNDILRRDRNVNILKYASSLPCSHCNGLRLNPAALSVRVNGLNIADYANMELSELRENIELLANLYRDKEFVQNITQKLIQQIAMFESLGMQYLSLSRPSNTLSGGEVQRVRLINQTTASLSNVLYVFDEPSAGMHPQYMHQLTRIFRQLVNQGNTLIVAEHDLACLMQADFVVDIGPGAGQHGGRLLFAGSIADFCTDTTVAEISPTRKALDMYKRHMLPTPLQGNVAADFILNGCTKHNLKNIEAGFIKGALNIVCGLAGSGKNSLVHGELEIRVNKAIEQNKNQSAFDKLIVINQSPIGRSPRSNPATYTKLSDKIRDLFADTIAAKQARLSKSHFSFNTAGGRCETCMGAGQVQIGMHFLGNVNLICSSCGGKRFNSEVLQILYKEKNIAEVYELTVSSALMFFADVKSIASQLQTLVDLGLGYLTLGQSSTTLSGGEAQRIKLAAHLQQANTGNTLYILNEPTVGLHNSDMDVLLQALKKLTNKGNTIVCIENDGNMLAHAQQIIELGPGCGSRGGEIVFQGPATAFFDIADTPTANALRKRQKPEHVASLHPNSSSIQLQGVSTHYLKNIDVDIPNNKLTLITGLSGTGKSSLAFDTLFAESRSRFSESLSSYVRSLIKLDNRAIIENCSGLCPSVAISRKHLGYSSRSTVGTITGIYEHFRLMYSRIAQHRGLSYTAQHFSFNHELGACPHCEGRGEILTTDPDKLITHSHLPISGGAMQGSKPGQYYGDPHGRFVAIISCIAREMGIDIETPWQQLPDNFKNIVLFGTGNIGWEAEWQFKNKTRSGTHRLSTTWEGFCNIIDDEYRRKHQNKTIDNIAALLHTVSCHSCHGAGLKPELLEVSINHKNIAELSMMAVKDIRKFFATAIDNTSNSTEKAIIAGIGNALNEMLDTLQHLGLHYLSINRKATGLSGGEAQRLRIAGVLAANLSGVCYVLDEPGIGLHSSDKATLISVLKRLIDKNNTVVVVEHDESFIKAADNIIEMGPVAGKNGGYITASGSLPEILNSQHSVTAQYLLRNKQNYAHQRNCNVKSFGLYNATANNLQGCNIDFISGGIIVVTGVSGSGKSSLINHVLLPSSIAGKPVHCSGTYGLQQFSKIVHANQQAIGNNALSTPASYSGILDDIRKLYAATGEAGLKGLKNSDFSYHHAQGKCPECNGHGQIRISMDFMSDVFAVCDTCGGNRYRRELENVRLHGLNIGEMLNCTILEAHEVLRNETAVAHKLQTCIDVGIGHLQLGQSAATLSGGEAQRLKLASEMMKASVHNTLFLLDEPGTGLHYFDILKLIDVFNRLANNGNTIIFIEHNPTLIAIANQLIEMGLGSGNDGGRIVRNELIGVYS